ncbi:homocysteine S-methyltransferase [Streptomyces cinereoruber]|uniref:Homocysteine S-methyltransferase n=1 Tax=Streptomyces cinereoruber TaxID=67260 RepID=A0AAV4KTI5_9ACTN|nr:homocysteine S-methyltransferase [Streptomyces cinereoruber]MBB4161061.1 homocysteine S-methyltransferase [Streptomyces cinereoruber]MBY8818838.1 homocysteine S-methyltransferase [Streptomyces cinereoruber]NIH62527.1 homocysteine S-methyltransferase [Streptomyces cinereoruber]QEV35239.1 homocysteine S-methyltransferase [Streptomyces cinereoruber]GGR42439.1 homocysteine S-methyltransferase [Streptomyces cinereoruber]
MRPARTLADALRAQVLVLDGGLSHQLEAQGCDLSDALWSARLLADGPERIEEAHTAYVRAGARVLITSGYQATFEGFARRGLDRKEAARLLARSVELARSAADGAAEEVWVAASVGPYGAMLADGSEYRGRYGLSVRELEAFHRPRIEVFAAAGPDVLALETVPDAAEAEALLRAAEGCGVPVWLSYTVEGGRTRAGQDLAEAFAVAAGNEQVVAVGINCCDPADAGPAVETAVAVTGKPAVVYPNSGEHWDARARDWRGGSAFDPGRAAAWVRSGARLVGGCCRVGPDAITALAETLAADGRD